MALDPQLEKLFKNPTRFYIMKFKFHFFIGIGFLLVTNALDAVYPMILKRAIDQISAEAGLQALTWTVALFFAVLASLAGTRYAWRVFFGRYHTLAAEDLRNRIFTHLTSLGPSFYQRSQVGELMSLITNDVQAFRSGIGSGLLILIDGISIVFLVLPLMLYLEPNWTWQTLIFLPLVPFLIMLVTKLTFRAFKNQQEWLSKLAGFCQEVVGGIKVIKGFHQEKNRLSQYNQISKEYEKSAVKVGLLDAFFPPVMQFGVASGTVILLFVSAGDLISGAVTIGTFVAFQRYISKMVWPMTALGYGFSQFQKGMASFARIKDVLQEEKDLVPTGEFSEDEFKSLVVKELSFSYSDHQRKILNKVSFELRPGETLGIVGPVGSGKSTLLNIITRLYTDYEGEILLNGRSIRDWDTESLRRMISSVTQEPFLFSESVIDNVRFGNKQASEDQVADLLEAVDLKQEMMSLSQGLQSELGERGVNLSGGQKQRLALARGLMMQSPVLFLDDVLSAVDTKTEEVIEQALQKNRGQSRILVSHRLSVLKNADRILVLNAGQVEACGSISELMIVSPTFKNIYDIQKEELKISVSTDGGQRV
jgi:ATP-binding cassette subfamily B protein